MRVTANIRSVPADLKAAVVQDARSQERSVTAVVTALLGQQFGVPVNTSPRRTTTPSVAGDQLNLAASNELLVALDRYADQEGLTRSSTVIQLLAAHYGLPPVPPQARRRRRSFMVGERVRFQDSQDTGVVAGIHVDGRYDVRWDDGTPQSAPYLADDLVRAER